METKPKFYQVGFEPRSNATEYYHCTQCGKWPIAKRVDTERDELAKEPACPICGGKTIFEKVRGDDE